MSAATLAPPAERLELRPYQRQAAEAVIAGYRRGLRRMLVQLATGLGKTVLFAHLAPAVVASGRRVLVIAHRDELLTQARDKLLAVDPTADVGLVRAELDGIEAQIVVASIQTIVNPKRLTRLGRFGLIVIDEAHHAAAASYRAVLESLGAFEPDGPCVLGVTATPGRGDGVGLDSIFQEIVYRVGILEGIQQGYLCDVRAVSVTLATSFDDVHTRNGDLAEGELGEALIAADAPAHVARAYLDHAAGRRAIVFTPTVAVAQQMADALNDVGVTAAWVSGETPRDERRATLAALKAGTVRAVANCSVLVEGFDCPPVDCIITARPTKSASSYTQMVGRGTRIYPGKDDCLVLDVVGQAGRHDLVTAATLFGLDPRELARRTVTQALAARQLAQDAEERRRADDGARLVARPVELFKRRPLHWVAAGADRFVLSIPGGRIVLGQDRRGWTAALERYGEHPLVIGRDLPLEYATGVAEDRARQMGALALVDPNAPWRGHPASEKQLDLLRRRGMRLRPDLTAGQASDLIAAGLRGRAS